MNGVVVVLIILLSVLLSGLFVRIIKFKLPLPIVQILFGILISSILEQGVYLEPQVFLLIFIPPLLFFDGWRIPKLALKNDWINISSLSVLLVVFTMIGLGFFINYIIPSIPLALAFALSAIISPTDPVAVSSITRRLVVPHRVKSLLEGESLFNDATGLVAFKMSVLVFLTGIFSIYHTLLEFFWVVIIGILTGFIVTRTFYYLRQKFTNKYEEDINLEVIFSLLIPFISYLISEHMGASGVLSAVAAGITMSKIEFRESVLPMTRMRRTAVWDTFQFLLNGAIFVILGEQIPGIISNLDEIAINLGYNTGLDVFFLSLLIFSFLFILRFLWVLFTLKINSIIKKNKNFTVRDVTIITISGVRGTITLAGVLSLPLLLPSGEDLPNRQAYVFFSATIILISLVFASFILPIVLRFWKEKDELRRPIVDDGEFLFNHVQDSVKSNIFNMYCSVKKDFPEITEDVFRNVVSSYSLELKKSFIIQFNNNETESSRLEKKIRKILIENIRRSVYRLEESSYISDDDVRKIIRRLDFHDVLFNKDI